MQRPSFVQPILNITSGDCAGRILEDSGVPGAVVVWHDILYDGPRRPGWPDEEALSARATFLEGQTGGGLKRAQILATLRAQYQVLIDAIPSTLVRLWFDACLFDQSMLVHVLTCLDVRGVGPVELICVDSFPDIVPYHGLGQLTPDQLASQIDRRFAVSGEQFDFAREVDAAFAEKKIPALTALSRLATPALPWIPAAASRWLEELPDNSSGLGKLQRLALDAIRSGCEVPSTIMKAVAEADTPPQYWGDSTLWAKINELAERKPPLVEIKGPGKHLPQSMALGDVDEYRVGPMPREILSKRHSGLLSI